MIAETTDELLTVFRREVDDVIDRDEGPVDADKLWKNAEIYQYMTEAANKVAVKVEGLYKKIQFAITPAPVTVPATPVPIKLPREILHIREAKLLSLGLFLEPSQADNHMKFAYNSYGPSVRNSALFTYGVPNEYYRDYERNALILSPIQNITDTLELQCTVTICSPLKAGMDLPFVDPEDQRLMLHYMKKQAYEKQDVEAMDLDRSKYFEQVFESGAQNRQTRLRSYRRVPRTMPVEGW